MAHRRRLPQERHLLHRRRHQDHLARQEGFGSCCCSGHSKQRSRGGSGRDRDDRGGRRPCDWCGEDEGGGGEHYRYWLSLGRRSMVMEEGRGKGRRMGELMAGEEGGRAGLFRFSIDFFLQSSDAMQRGS